MRPLALLTALALLAPPAPADDWRPDGNEPVPGPTVLITPFRASRMAAAVPRGPELFPGGEEAARRSGIALWVYSTLKPGHGEDATMETFTRGAFARAAGERKVLLSARSAEELKSILDFYRGKGVPIRSLTVAAHGSPTATAIFGLTELGKLAGADEAMAPGAELDFLSCSVSEGYVGAFFVIRIADVFLKKGGGTVRSSRGTHFRWDLATDAGLDARLLSGELGTPSGYSVYSVAPGGEGRFTEGFVAKTEAAYIARRLKHLEKKLTAHGIEAGEPWRLWDQSRTLLASSPLTDERVARAGALMQGAEHYYGELVRSGRR